jgi:hypothetical protein
MTYQLNLDLIDSHEAAMLPWVIVSSHHWYGIGFNRCGFVGQALILKGCQAGNVSWRRVEERAEEIPDIQILPCRFLRIPYAGPRTKEAAATLLNRLFVEEAGWEEEIIFG